jgi:drug/metabolite transporter (DMT)-like permease
VSSLTNNQRGIVAICACMASFTINDVLVKQILHTYPIGEVIFVRGVMSTILIGAIALAFGHARELRRAVSGKLATRSACDGLSTACFIAALSHMPLANLAAVLQIAPLLITALSVLVYREVVGWRRWLAIGIGFAGALLIIKPLPSAFNVWALVGVGAALTSALREIQTRRIGHDVPVLVVAFWGAVAITVCGLFFAVTERWLMFTAVDLFKLFVASVFVGCAIFLLALAFRDVDLSTVAPFRYSYLLTSAIGGYIVFRELPDGLTVVGAALIVASGIYTLHREAAIRREMMRNAMPAQ